MRSKASATGAAPPRAAETDSVSREAETGSRRDDTSSRIESAGSESISAGRLRRYADAPSVVFGTTGGQYLSASQDDSIAGTRPTTP